MRTFALDIECYKNYFLCLMMDVESGELLKYEKFNDSELDGSLQTFLKTNRIITFNGKNYDVPVYSYAIAGASNQELKDLGDDIIQRNKKYWELERERGFSCFAPKHIDLIEVAIGQASLKTYGGRLHSEKIQDLPIEPDAEISEADRQELITYCENDLRTTIDLYKFLMPQLKLRMAMSRQYNLDLLSKSDAQIAEAVIVHEIEKTGLKLSRPKMLKDEVFKYNVPDFISFESQELKNLLEDVRSSNFGIDMKGVMMMPLVLDSREVVINGKPYALGIGGLHSVEKKVSHQSEGCKIYDRDVTSYYPSIILNLKLYPKHIGEIFLTIYRGIMERRVAAKHSGDMITSDVLKIVLNGSYGKLGSIWSKLFAPQLLIQTTLTGQLSLLMFIERMELSGNEVISANTDGVVTKVTNEASYLEAVKWWEEVTGFNTEETEYDAIYSRDVNSYLAIKPDGKVKLKGAYAIGGLSKNPSNTICIEAVVSFLKDGKLIAETINEEQDIKKFVTIRSVKGGAVWGDVFLGKAVRWYYAKNLNTTINYKSNGNKVPRSDGAMPMMVMLPSVPDDLDRDWYIKEAHSFLKEVGYVGTGCEELPVQEAESVEVRGEEDSL